MGRTITQEYADRLLEFDLTHRFLPTLEKIPYWSEMNDNQRGALLSFAYNLGAGFYNSNNFNTISRNLREKNWKAIPETLKMYRNPGTKVEAGLLRRRTAEGKLWISQSSILAFKPSNAVNKVNKASYPLLSDSLQSNGGGFNKPPKAFALFIEPGTKK